MTKTTGLALPSKTLLSVAVSTLLFSGYSMANTVPSNPSVLSGVVVTANKIEENSNNVPQAITVIDSFELEDKGIKSVADIINEVPNMSIQTNGGEKVSFRGLNPSIFTGNNPVVVYIDGVATSDYYAFDASLANVERVEVLRGPQGTLYGKDAIGAIINIVTKDPTNKWSGSVGAELGERNTQFKTFNASGALVQDKVFMGINGQMLSDDGWIKNEAPGMDRNANAKDDSKLGMFILLKPNDRLKAKLNISHDTRTVRWYDGYGLPGGSELNAFKRKDAEHVNYDVAQNEKVETDAQSLNVGYEFNNMSLSSTTTHRNVKLAGDYDSDFGVNPMFAGLKQFNRTNSETYSQELRLASNNKTGVRWVGGLYFDTEKRKQGPYGMQFPNFDPVTYAPLGNFEMDARSNTTSNTQAAFGQIMIPFAQKWELTLGQRLQRIDKDFDINMYYLPVGSSGPAMYSLKDNKSWDAMLPKAALSYQINPNWTAYGSYSKGYMPGGYNYFATAGSSADNSFDPQTSDNYELGIKGAFEKVTVAANIFYMNIQDIHVYKAIGAMYLTDNAKRAHSQGVELDIRWLPTTNLEFSGALGFINAKYDDYNNGVQKFDGQTTAETPSYTARFSVAYSPTKNWYGRIDLKNQGDTYYYDDANKKFSKHSGYFVTDVKAGYRVNNWDVYGFVKNLTDEQYVQGYMASSMVSLATFGAPRLVGVGARYNF